MKLADIQNFCVDSALKDPYANVMREADDFYHEKVATYHLKKGSRRYTLDIRKKHLLSLRPEEHLYERIVDCYFTLIEARGEWNSMPVFSFDARFGSDLADLALKKDHLTKETNDDTRYRIQLDMDTRWKNLQDDFCTWTDGTDILERDFILVPVLVENCHWCLVVVENWNKRRGSKAILYSTKLYDSQGDEVDDGSMIERTILNFFRDLLIIEGKRRNKILPETSFSRGYPRIPKQFNRYDCGIFICMYAEFITRGVTKPRFTEAQMPDFRRQMAYEIIDKKLFDV